ncbi:hypothetical protein FACS189437_06970 [Bacteroidia bacterium]|nr:hypothetical protein FACS189437_06970 [Bacteroidia bacterium]
MSIDEQELRLLKWQTNLFNAEKLRAKFSEKSQSQLRNSIGHLMGYIKRYSGIIINFGRNGNSTKKFLFRESLKLENKIISGFFLIMEVALGFFGLGIPNMYFFVALLYRCCNNNALLYGFDPNNGQTFYLLNYSLVVYCANDRITKNAVYNSLLENIDKLELDSDKLNEIDNAALNGIVDVLFAIKLLQCVPVIGTIGGVLCWNEFRKMVKFERLKFERIQINNKHFNNKHFNNKIL